MARLTVPASAALAALALAATGCAHHRAGRDVLQVSGEGRASAKPDLASVALGVEAIAPQVKAAVADADARVRAISAALARAGVPEKDVRTVAYDVQMERRYDPQRPGPGEITGYRVAHVLRVVVRGGDPAKAGAALEAALAAGANVVNSIAFEKEDPTPERAKALEAAVASARAKAEALARASGRTLGRAVAIREGGGGGPVVPMRAVKTMAMEAGGAPLQAGELEFGADVQVEFELR